MGVQDLGGPRLPVSEEARELFHEAELGVGLEQGHGRRRRPGRAWSITTRTSRRWYEPYSEKRKVTTRATAPRPVIAAIAAIILAKGPTATKSPKPRVSTEVAAKYTVVPRLVGTGRSWSRTANRIRP